MAIHKWVHTKFYKLKYQMQLEKQKKKKDGKIVELKAWNSWLIRKNFSQSERLQRASQQLKAEHATADSGV